MATIRCSRILLLQNLNALAPQAKQAINKFGTTALVYKPVSKKYQDYRQNHKRPKFKLLKPFTLLSLTAFTIDDDDLELEKDRLYNYVRDRDEQIEQERKLRSLLVSIINFFGILFLFMTCINTHELVTRDNIITCMWLWLLSMICTA